MNRPRRLPLVSVWLVLVFLPIQPSAAAQQGPPYSLEHLEAYLSVGLDPQLILARVRGDCLAFRMDAAALERLQAAGAHQELLAALGSVCHRGPAESLQAPLRVQYEPGPWPQPSARATAIRYDPGSAALKSLVLPGLGQLSTGRPVMGALFMAGWAGALSFGVFTREVTVECMDLVAGGCPPHRVLRETVRRPSLGLGLGGAAALAVLSALDARSGAELANARSISVWEGSGHGGVSVEAFPAASTGAHQDLVMVQLRFWWRTNGGVVTSISAEGSTAALERGLGTAVITTTADGVAGSLRVMVRDGPFHADTAGAKPAPAEPGGVTGVPPWGTAIMDSIRSGLAEVSRQAGLAEYDGAYALLEEVGARLADLHGRLPGLAGLGDLDKEYADLFRLTYVRCDVVRRTMLERGEAHPPACRAPPTGGGDDPT
jgi:hypothetical protein